MDEYARIFDQRGSAYDQAMRAYPRARFEEFAQILAHLDLQPGMVIGDVPAGGGYLREYLPDFCRYLTHEPSAGFTGHGGGADGSASGNILPLPWQKDTLDVAISLAGVHHLEPKVPLFSALSTAMRPNGRFVLSDGPRGSATALFLDDFVGAWNGTGHRGHYLDDTTPQELEDSGWIVESRQTVDFHWRFATRESMIDFAARLFNIAAAGPAAIEQAIESRLGIDTRGDGTIGMRWSLETIVSRNAKDNWNKL